MWWTMGLYALVMLAFCGFILRIGILGLRHQRPLIVPARQFVWFFMVVFGVGVIQMWAPLLEFGAVDWFSVGFPLFQTAMFVLMVWVIYKQMVGRIIFGVSEDLFRDALIHALDKLSLPYKETISKIRLTELGVDLQVAVASWMGTAQIRAKQAEHRHHADHIMDQIELYFAKTPVTIQKLPFLIYIVLGVLLAIFNIFFVFFFIFSF